MNACRAERAVFVAVLLAFAAANVPAAAQGPTLLRPPAIRSEPAAPPPPPTAAPPAAAPVGPSLSGPAGIEVESARPLDPEATGLIDTAQGGLSADTWAPSNRLLVERLMRDLPAPLASQPLRQLVWRTLASSAAGPLVADGSKPETNFVALRALRLRALGDAKSAAELARRVPDRMADPAMVKLLADEAWLAGADERACALVRDGIARRRDVALQKALMFCQALAGDSNRAQLGLAMLRDQGVPEDAAFVTLLLSAGGDGKGVRVDSLRNADALSLAMLRAAKVAPPADIAQSNDPAVLAAVALGDLGTPELRLAAAERAEAYGGIASDKLAALYGDLELTAAQVSDAANFARGDGGPRGRAALFKAAKAAPAGAERLAALQALWNQGRERGGYATLARASIGLVGDIAPSPEFAAAAPDVARALLMAGERDKAEGWIRLVRAAQAGGDAAADQEATRLWLLATLAGLENTDARSPGRLDAWRQTIEKRDARTAPARAALGVALLSGLGHLPAGGALVAVPPTAMERQPVVLPHPVLWTGLHEAGIAGRAAECVLLVTHMLGSEGAAGATPYVLLSVLDGLRAVGFEDQARLMALEAAIASGL
jgi:hypothetical protein